LLGKYSKIMV